MTSDDRRPSENPSGERSEPRGSEGPEEREATTDPSEKPSGETASDGEERSDGSEAERRAKTNGTGDAVPLNIAGHESRDAPGETDRTRSRSSELAFDDADDGDPTSNADPADDTSEEEEEVEPVELLVQLAKEGEIDPWDIDIVAVTDTFLDALDEADLRTSGRALFYASVLLRMKSDELFGVDEPDEEELPPWEAPFVDDPIDDVDPGFDPIAGLEAEMDRRLERKHARGKPETLDELVRELRDAERGTWWKESRSYDTSDSPHGFSRGVQELSYHSGDDYRVDDEPTAADVTHTAHEEDIETVIDDVESELETHYEQGRDEVLYAEVDEVGGSRVMTYLALLFLSHRGSVRLAQDELFGDLWIQQATLDAEVHEAIAD